MITVSNLGAVPIVLQIVGSVITGYVKMRLTQGQAAAQTAAEFNYFQNVSETRMMEVATELERATGKPYWDWFVMLRSLQEYGVIDPVGEKPIPVPGRPEPTPQPKPKPPPKKPTTELYITIAAGLLAVIFLMRPE